MASAAAPTSKPPKGILKKPSSNPTATPPSRPTAASNSNSNHSIIQPFLASDAPTNPTQDERYEQAVALATYGTIELLATLPRDHASSASISIPATHAYSAANPSPSEAELFKSEVIKLTQSEFSELVEERNCRGRCGYALCAQERRSFPNEFKIWRGDVAPTAELNKWCSDMCARRALNVQLQLGVVPSFSGVVPPGTKLIELLGEEPAKGQEDGESKKEAKLPLEPSMSKIAVMSRGGKLEDEDDIVVIEKKVTAVPQAPDKTQPLHNQAS